MKNISPGAYFRNYTVFKFKRHSKSKLSSLSYPCPAAIAPLTACSQPSDTAVKWAFQHNECLACCSCAAAGADLGGGCRGCVPPSPLPPPPVCATKKVSYEWKASAQDSNEFHFFVTIKQIK